MNDKKREKNIISDLSEKPLNEIPPFNQLAILLVYLLEYFEAGGLSEEESKEIFDIFLECIGNRNQPISNGENGFQVIEVLEKIVAR